MLYTKIFQPYGKKGAHQQKNQTFKENLLEIFISTIIHTFMSDKLYRDPFKN